MAQVTQDDVLHALSQVNDPELNRDLVSLGMVKDIAITGAAVAVRIELTTPACPLKHTIRQDVEAALKAIGADAVTIEFGASVPSRRKEDRLPSVKHIVAVASGKGGVGKSTVAVNLALALKRHGSTVGLLDADVYGPSVPHMLGRPEVATKPAANDRIAPAVYHGIQVMSVGFFVERAGAVVWRGPMVHKLLTQFIDDVEWGELDYLVIDLPPGTGDVQISLSQLVPLTGAVMVTTPQEVALNDVIRGCSMFEKVEVPLLGIIENMSFYACPKCGHHDHIFAAGGGRRLADEVGAPLLGEVPINGRIAASGDAGLPIVVGAPDSEQAQIFMAIAGRLAGRISQTVLGGRQHQA
ncbi:MAG TPA: iron-sulfur cluster carrier protein ApbC [Polyangia bacterium]